MISLDNLTGCRMFLTMHTPPAFIVVPSIMDASISTSPLKVMYEPRPRTKKTHEFCCLGTRGSVTRCPSFFKLTGVSFLTSIEDGTLLHESDSGLNCIDSAPSGLQSLPSREGRTSHTMLVTNNWKAQFNSIFWNAEPNRWTTNCTFVSAACARKGIGDSSQQKTKRKNGHVNEKHFVSLAAEHNHLMAVGPMYNASFLTFPTSPRLLGQWKESLLLLARW